MIHSAFLRITISALILTAPLSATAQGTLATLSAGDLVHVRAPGTGPEGLRGTVDRVTADSLVIRLVRSQDRRAFATDSLWRLDLARHYAAPAGRVATDAGIGTVAGLLVGAGLVRIAQITRPDCGECAFGPTPEERRLWADENSRELVLGALAAGAVGGAVFAWRRVRRGMTEWRRIPLDDSSPGASSARAPRDVALGIGAYSVLVAWSF